MPELPDIRSASGLCGARVILRGSLNVPLAGGTVSDAFRLEALRDTIDFLHDAGARTVIVGHIGRNPAATLRPVYKYFSRRYRLSFIPDPVGAGAVDAVARMGEGDIALCENLRRYPGEERNDPAFAEALSRLGDVYVNDAFSSSHRRHASIVGVPRVLARRYAGVRFIEEVEHISRVFRPEHPMIAVVGGAKFETKEPLIAKLLSVADEVFVGGAIANDFLRAEGYEIGRSLHSRADVSHMRAHRRLRTPVDVVVDGPDGGGAKPVGEVLPEETILDIGPESAARISRAAEAARMIVWNGPLGYYENGYAAATRRLADAIASRGVPAVVGGGDTASALRDAGAREKFAFISTGGSALLEYLVSETLPGIEALCPASGGEQS